MTPLHRALDAKADITATITTATGKGGTKETMKLRKFGAKGECISIDLGETEIDALEAFLAERHMQKDGGNKPEPPKPNYWDKTPVVISDDPNEQDVD